jgi:integrase
MILNGKRYPNLIQKASGFYWNPPPAARSGNFSTIPFGKEFGPDEMTRYYAREAALARWKAESKGGAQTSASEDTVEGLFRDYLASRKVREKSQRTQDEYRRCLTALWNFVFPATGARFGEQPWARLKARHADALYDAFVVDEDGAPRPVYARGCMHVARQAWNWAKRPKEGQWKCNPFAEMGLKTPKPRRVKWTPAEVLAFARKAEEMGMLSVGMAAILCWELGQRVSDARLMCRSAFERLPDGRIGVRVLQQKTDEELLLPVSPLLATWLEKIPASLEHLVVSEKTGETYADWELSKAAAEVRKAAGIRDEVRLGDLRRTCLTELGRAGATDDEMVAVSGHKNRLMLHVYSLAEYEKALRAQAARWALRDAA